METIASLPPPAQAPGHFRFTSKVGEHLLVVPHSRVYDLTPMLAEWLDDPAETRRVADLLGEAAPGEVSLDDVVVPSVQSLSLNVSSGCNLSCGYCYADRGSFLGRQSKSMTAEVAFAGVDALFEQADPRAPVTVGFLGGEPLINRQLVHGTVHYAEQQAARRGLDLRFSITTNGTLLRDDDVQLLRGRRFAVTVSVDGDAVTHDRQRPLAGRGRSGSFAALARGMAPLLAEPGLAQISARVTVGRNTLQLEERVAAILALGFEEVGISPLRVAADHSELGDDDWDPYLSGLIGLAEIELDRVRRGLGIRLTNLAVALKQIHRGASSPYPCGAGGGYFSLSADGKWYACHRAIGDAEYQLGENGQLDEAQRAAFLKARHVHAQTDCANCWARYLCSGSCHQEAGARTPGSCGFIRSWLHYCLSSYCELSSSHPSFFASANQESER